MYFHVVPFLPDVAALRVAADRLDRTAATVEADASTIASLVEGVPWRGPRREVVRGTARAAVAVARAQAGAERELARSLRQLALEVEEELRFLIALAERARRHLEELLRRARALVEATADAVRDAAAQVATRVLLEVATLDPAGAVREARALAEEALDRLRSITLRLQSLPLPHDPQWRRLGPEILAWRP